MCHTSDDKPFVRRLRKDLLAHGIPKVWVDEAEIDVGDSLIAKIERGASLAVTQRQIIQIEPLFQRIYSRIDPHPTFRVTQITAAMERGKGHLNLGILDPEMGSDGRDAGPLLSSS